MLLPSIATALLVTMIFMVAFRPLAKSVGLVDIPGGRKKHVGEVPIIGGIAMFLGSAVGLSLLPSSNPTLIYLAVAGGLLVVIGALDDRYGMPASVRLIAQFVAVLVMVFGANLQIAAIGDPFGFGVIHLGPASVIITILVTGSVINAFNLVDGVDGLAGSMALIAMISIALVGGYQSALSMTALIAAAATLGFLFFNFPTVHNRRVRTFMGDAGSTLVGLVIVWVTIGVSQGPAAFVTPVVCLWFVAMPVFDLFTCLVTRTLKGHSPLKPGRDHFHHVLLRGGMGVRSVLGVLTGLQLIYAMIGLVGHFAGATDVVMFGAWAVVGLSQNWMIRRYAAMYRLDLRSRRARETAVAFRLPGHHRLRGAREQVIIYGAGKSGAELAICLFGGDKFLPLAMVDDDSALCGKKVEGLKVHSPSDIASLVDGTDVARVILAMPSASRNERFAVLERLSDFSVQVQTIPEKSKLVAGTARVDHICDVHMEDVLGWDPVAPDAGLLGKSVTGKIVLVTGAGGSIGSELCRQILELHPTRLVLFELSELALSRIDEEIKELKRQLGSKCEVAALLGSVHNEGRIWEIMETFRIQTVYHAAAYKHVSIVEQNLFQGIHNNVFGTLHTVRAAIETGVETFVLISTDEAVSPTSVMGATKRFAELILQAYNTRKHKTRLCMVRFGDVIESSSSVMPLFREQIRSGGPVTVTHRDNISYLMKIPEAAQLVIQAASMAHGGDVFVLDMGEPVKILDLASRMINVMGLTVRDKANPDGDIEIQFTGLRPAEKLYEELLTGANITGTDHPRIMRADEDYLPFDALWGILDDLQTASVQLAHDGARELLLSAVKEYRPGNGIDDLVWMRRNKLRSDGTSETVVDFASRQARATD